VLGGSRAKRASINTHINSGFQFVDGNAAFVAQELSADVLTDWGGAIKLKKHICLQQVLRSRNFGFGDRRANPHELFLDVEQHLLKKL